MATRQNAIYDNTGNFLGVQNDKGVPMPGTRPISALPHHHFTNINVDWLAHAILMQMTHTTSASTPECRIWLALEPKWSCYPCAQKYRLAYNDIGNILGLVDNNNTLIQPLDTFDPSTDPDKFRDKWRNVVNVDWCAQIAVMHSTHPNGLHIPADQYGPEINLPAGDARACCFRIDGIWYPC
ncbi:MAG: hypothetical protein U1F68_01230 [Gammaproteobacteria bacterium]